MSQPYQATAQNSGCLPPPAGGPGGGFFRARLTGLAAWELKGLEEQERLQIRIKASGRWCGSSMAACIILPASTRQYFLEGRRKERTNSTAELSAAFPGYWLRSQNTSVCTLYQSTYNIL